MLQLHLKQCYNFDEDLILDEWTLDEKTLGRKEQIPSR